jgi:hypothetical protein
MTLDPAAVEARYAELIAAWARHDLPAIQAMHAPGAELVIGGRHDLAGRYVGPGALLAALVKFAPYVQAGAPHTEQIEFRDGEVESASLVTIRSPLKPGEIQTVFRTTIRFDEEGRILHVHNRADDQQALDAFFGVLDSERR